VDEQAERIGRNEALFRHVNERLKEVGSDFSLVSEDAAFVCECGDVACTQEIRMTLAEYEHVRTDPTWFAVVAGHEIPAVEWVVRRHEGWNVVQKREGDPADVAREEAPAR
jgi:hypothetical protein